MTFDPATSYSQDHELHDFIEDVTWEVSTPDGLVSTTGFKGKWGDFDTPDLVSVAASLGLSSEAAAVVVWQPKPDDADWEPTFAPKPGHILRREEKGNEGWVIMGHGESRFGNWTCFCEKEVLNA